MKTKDLKINFRYLGGNIACLNVDSIDGESVHNDINNEEAIIIFNSLVGEKEKCQTVKKILQENQQLKKQLEDITLCRDIASGHREELQDRENILLNQQKEFLEYLEDEIEKATTNPYTKLSEYGMNRIHIYKEILQKYKEMVGVSDENNKQ